MQHYCSDSDCRSAACWLRRLDRYDASAEWSSFEFAATCNRSHEWCTVNQLRYNMQENICNQHLNQALGQLHDGSLASFVCSFFIAHLDVVNIHRVTLVSHTWIGGTRTLDAVEIVVAICLASSMTSRGSIDISAERIPKQSFSTCTRTCIYQRHMTNGKTVHYCIALL